MDHLDNRAERREGGDPGMSRAVPEIGGVVREPAGCRRWGGESAGKGKTHPGGRDGNRREMGCCDEF